MGRSTDLKEYKHLWKGIGHSTYQIDSPARIEEALENGEIKGSLPPRYVSIYYEGLYLFLSVKGNNTIVSSFELNFYPNKVTYDSYTVDEHCRDRMSQRQITTGLLRDILDDYILFDRVSRYKFKLCSRVEEEEYYVIVDTETQTIETVWRN